MHWLLFAASCRVLIQSRQTVENCAFAYIGVSVSAMTLSPDEVRSIEAHCPIRCAGRLAGKSHLCPPCTWLSLRASTVLLLLPAHWL